MSHLGPWITWHTLNDVTTKLSCWIRYFVVILHFVCYYVMGQSPLSSVCYVITLWVCQSPLSSVCYVIIYNYVMGQSPSVCRQNGFHAITFILTDRPFNEVGFDCRDCCHTCFQTGPKMLKWCHFFKENWEIFSRGSNPYSDDVN